MEREEKAETHIPDIEENLIDDWYLDDEEEDVSANEDEDDGEETSSLPETEDRTPDDEDPEEDAQASTKGTSAEPEKKDDPYEWVNELDPTFREKAEALVHSVKSDKGRVAALQRRLDSVAAQQEAEQRTQPSAAAKQAVADGKPLEDMDDEELAAFMEEFPTVAKNVEKMFEKRFAKEREQLLGTVRPLQQAQLAQQIEQRKVALREKASHIFNTAETGVDMDDVLGSRAFHQWVAEQTPAYIEFARKAEEVEDASKVLEDFARYMDGQVSVQLGKGERAADDTKPSSRQSADQVAARRKSALKGTGVKSRSAEIDLGGSGDDYEAQFDALLRQRSGR
jgi:hypothetical protein